VKGSTQSSKLLSLSLSLSASLTSAGKSLLTLSPIPLTNSSQALVAFHTYIRDYSLRTPGGDLSKSLTLLIPSPSSIQGLHKPQLT
jgi:hypothetical protein